MSAKMTLIGMYNYDNTLFNNMTFPSGIDKSLVISTLLMHGGEFEVLYPQPDFMKYAIGAWSGKWERTFSEWLRGTQASWNPIHNYDRIEDVRDEKTGSHSQKTEADYTDARTANLTDGRTANLTEQRTANLQDQRTAALTDQTTLANTDTTTQTVAGTTEHEVSAYDSATYQPSSKDTISNGTSTQSHTGTVTVATTGTDTNATTGTDTNTTTGTDTLTHTGTDNTRHAGTLSDISGSDSETNVHTAHMYGNIGVTTSASMLSEFYDIAMWNLYEHISDVFISELLIPVY